MEKLVKVAVDAMGGDHAPGEVVKGAVDAVNEKNNLKVFLVGKAPRIHEELSKYQYKNEQIEVVNAEEEISCDESPVEAIRKKKDSSMVVALKMVKDKTADAFVSAGSTGAFMAGGLLMVGRIKGIDRPALCPILPTYDGKGFMLIDCGANTNCKPINLFQFAKMGSIYMNKVMHVEDPKVGLLNIGTEEGKGNDLTKEAFVKFSETDEFNFYGNVEGRDIFNGDVSVVVSDGFTGNVTLKTIEGMGSMISKLLKEELNANIWRKLLAALLMPALKNFKKRMDYSEYGGALLLGIKKPMVKCHGTANAKIVKYTLVQAENFAKNKVVETIENEIKKEEL